MRNPSNRRTLIFAAALALAFALPGVAPAAAQPPQIPATFFGRVTVDGVDVQPGAVVRAFVDGVDCTQPGSAGAFVEAGESHYLVDVMHETQSPGCGRTGAEVTFTVDGRAASTTAAWQSGPAPLDLVVGEPPPPSSPAPADAPQHASGSGAPSWMLPAAVAGALIAVAAAATAVWYWKAREKPRLFSESRSSDLD